KPIYSVFSQLIYIAVLTIVYVLTSTLNLDFQNFAILRSLAFSILIFSSLLFLSLFNGIPVLMILNNVYRPLISCAIMFIFGFFMQNIFDAIWWDVIVIILCASLYFLICFLFFKKDVKLLLTFIFKEKNKNVEL
ncbi:MAG: hypothetical protein M0P49_02240, partial [Bacilli bacterium]|nr:hypothetical protein [Bacilli bacterium]